MPLIMCKLSRSISANKISVISINNNRRCVVQGATDLSAMACINTSKLSWFERRTLHLRWTSSQTLRTHDRLSASLGALERVVERIVEIVALVGGCAGVQDQAIVAFVVAIDKTSQKHLIDICTGVFGIDNITAL